MNVHMSYRLRKTPAIEKQVNHFVAKLGRRLQDFQPGLVHLKGLVAESSAREGTCVSLNLRLPSGQMAAQETSAHPVAAIKRAFAELLQQLNKHKGRLRSSSKWPHWRRSSNGHAEPGVPFETTLAVLHLPEVSSDDINLYVTSHLKKLEHFVETELTSSEREDAIAITKEEVVDETIARALGDNGEKPERAAIEPWLRQLATHVIADMVAADAEQTPEVHLEQTVRRRNERASSEALLQFHQPDETFTEESIIADPRVLNPEAEAYSEEMTVLVQRALRHARREDREAFILYAMQGFTVEEISTLTHRGPEHTLSSIEAARQHLRHALPIAGRMEERALHSCGEN